MNILWLYLLCSGCFCFGFLLCAVLCSSKNGEEYQEIKTWKKEYEGKDVIHDGACYKIK